VETSQLCPPQVREAINAARAALEQANERAPADLAYAAEAAEIMGRLTESTELAHALLARPLLARAALTPDETAGIVGRPATEIATALLRLGTLGLPRDWSPALGLNTRQAETLRKMLLAVVSDPRLVLARLAEELVALRHARELPGPERERRALEARTIYAPLANRLGVWQLKWELEDLAFRYLEPHEYRRVAAALNERRADRERYIETLCAELHARLSASGIEAEVYGRPKHIYSIYRKMQRKQLAFEQLFDVRAVRVVVASVPECYGALGIVHGQWPYIPGEFDDYIATPKGNGYRSIHTAVIGPQGRSLEVQIRTPQMHEHAELGVAAHWTYKEGGARDAHYQRKIEWVRRLLEPHDGTAGGAESDRDLLEGMRTELFADRVYVLTPKGEVIDVPRGATPLDFAYSVHSSLGHRCRGAKVNGRIVPLTHALANGEVVEIITGKHDAPSRDWLAPEQGYLISARNRAKVRAWFRKQDVGDNRSAGLRIAERELARIGVRPRTAQCPGAGAQGPRHRSPASAAWRGRGHRYAAVAGCDPTVRAASAGGASAASRRAAAPGRAGRNRGRGRSADHAGALLCAAASATDHRLCHSGPGRHGPSQRLCEPAAHERAQARARAEGRMEQRRRGAQRGAVHQRL